MQASRIAAACVLAITLSTASHAQTAGSIYVTTGWFHFAPQDSSTPLKITSVGGNPVNITVPNTGAGISSSDTIGFTAGYFFTGHIAAEFEIGVPPDFDVSGTGSFARFGKVGTVKQWSPTLLFKYFFLEPQARFRPYLGIGVTRTSFSDGQITNATFESTVLGGPTTVEASTVWAPVFNVGFTYAFSEHWFAGFSVSYIPMSTTGTFTTQSQTPIGTLTRRAESKLTLDPIVTYLRVGYRF
ncbi:OmpW family outer membrane protein [Burkholderia sp. Ac-20365]|jgi:outer membrane protein|uniref:OmpW/AlkL family protein n=1 Tax=Burkholderia sp. Ac-20365 TaxID=2703897 RepID=UPI00197B7C50|nr:OmpW family outer membrane protein [Burkholderia sp. Ac-20365]MBN3763863.1 OmpW family protein [Burkholderia sp. Ac-20365]